MILKRGTIKEVSLELSIHYFAKGAQHQQTPLISQNSQQ